MGHENSGKFIDLTNKRFGRLTVLKRANNIADPSGRTRPAWLCKCDCGNECIVKGEYLRCGDTKSCGCLQKESTIKMNRSTKIKENKYRIDENHIVHITLTQNKEALCDESDLSLILQYKWSARKTKHGAYYASAAERNRAEGQKRINVQMHQLIMGAKYIDHINGDGLDNRRCNLRVYQNQKENMGNRQKKKPATSKYKGVTKRPNKQTYEVSCGGKYVGSFATEKEAALAYNTKAIELYGEFAKLNVVEE